MNPTMDPELRELLERLQKALDRIKTLERKVSELEYRQPV